MAWNQVATNATNQIATTSVLTVPHVCVLLPHTGTVTLEFVDTTYAPLKFFPQPDFNKSFRLSKGVPIHITRNELVKAALEDRTVTHTLFVDSDMIAESPTDVNQSLRTLLSLNAPVASGLYRAKKQKGDYTYAMWMKHPDNPNGYANLPQWTGNWIPVDAIGFGFVLIKREVWEKVPYPWFEWREVAPSEDFWACQQFQKYGYEIKVFTDVKFSHVGEMKVRTDGAIHVLDV